MTPEFPALYHGTDEARARRVLQAGFEMAEERHGRQLGRGIYVTPELGFAANWGPVVIECTLRPGARLLRTRGVDPRCVDSLRREFGAAIFDLDFQKAIPPNKRLTPNELATLWCRAHRDHLARPNPRRARAAAWYDALPAFCRQLRSHGFDAIAITDPDFPEVLVFNPSDLSPKHAHFCRVVGQSDGWICDVELGARL